MNDNEAIHTATVIRLQVAHNALQQVTGPLSEAMNLPYIASYLEQHDAGGLGADLREIKKRLDAARTLAIAALDIARGSRTDVPPELRGSLSPDTGMLTRFLEVPAGR